MKRIALLAVIGGSLLALPSTAAAQASDCSAAVGTTTAGDPCVDVGGGVGGELVIRPSGCSYINGSPGYAGICTNAVSRGPTCSTSGGSGANTGGCFQVGGGPGGVNQLLNTAPVGTVTAIFICGSTGQNPKNTNRDGCSIP